MAEFTDFPELELIDQLILRLEQVFLEANDTAIRIDAGEPPKRAIYRILNAAAGSHAPRPVAAQALRLDDTQLVLFCNVTEIVKGSLLDVSVQARKSGRGESQALIRGKATGLRRVRGGYEVDIYIEKMRRSVTTPGQKLQECLGKNDMAGWNRWCAEITDTINLTGLRLVKADLQGYDLCCADLTGTDLSGANLTGANLSGSDLARTRLDNAIVQGTDLFGARMNRRAAWAVQQSGLLETESIAFGDRHG